MLAMMFLFLRGTPFIYQGQEIGMTNIHMDSIEDYDDISTIDQYNRALQNGIDHDTAWKAIYKKSRDNARTPMQWDDSKQAGFSSADRTWLKVNENYKEINVKKSKEDTQSILEFYKTLIRLRKEGKYKSLLADGLFAADEAEDPCVMVYRRNTESESMIVYLNYQDKESTVKIPSGYTEKILGNYEEASIVDGCCKLRPYECISFYKVV
jgi:oligo-1,6-glucosidase/alpha-glucosidase